jgi:hypothetical protein
VLEEARKKHLKPDWLTKKEQVNPSVDEGTSPELLLCCMEVDTELIEYQLCGLTFLMAQKILSDPNVWIADSAVPTHSTGHTEGIYDLQHTGTSDNIIMGNGAKESAHSIGKLTGTICDQYGNQLNKTTMQDVTLFPTGMFNLFSLSIMQRRGGYSMGTSRKSGLRKRAIRSCSISWYPHPKEWCIVCT